MTNEELKNMPSIIDTLLDDAITDSTKQKVKDTLTEVCKLAIKTLEQQPNEDCISREHAKQFLYYEIERLHDDSLYDCFARIIDDMYNELPPVIPERPKGKWMECGGDEPWLKGYCCSLCNFTTTIKYNYCTCGAEMSGGEEDADSN